MTLTAALKEAVDAERDRKRAEDDRLANAILNERARRIARRVVDDEEREDIDVPMLERLDDALALPTPPMVYRIEALQPVDSRLVLSAQFKAGKTTVTGNLVRSLVDGDPFLDRYQVTPVAGTVAIVDLEMSRRQLLAWLREQQIRRADRVRLLSLRGRAGAFDVFTSTGRRPLVNQFRAESVCYLIVDCGRPILDAFGLDEHRDVGRLLTGIDALMAEAGIAEALIVQHMGHTGERSRGDSKWRDWPDVEWRLVRRDEDPASPRFISAYGRDVDVPEQGLAYDPATRRLSLSGGSRRDAGALAALHAVVDVLRASAKQMSGREIKRQLEDADVPRDAIDAALKAGVASGRLLRMNGPRNANLYRVPAPGVPDERPPDTPNERPGAYISPDARTVTRTVDGPVNGRTLDEGNDVLDRF